MGASQSAAAQEARRRAEEVARAVGAIDENAPLDVRGITMMMWNARDIPALVDTLADLLATHADEKHTFEQVEFYLPQMVHMILHLEVKWDSSCLERFALMISQQSLHFALQMNWILTAAMEDYQPEDGEGKANPQANTSLYLRCAMLQNNLERSVVFGSPRTAEFERDYRLGKISKSELMELELRDRRAAAIEFVAEGKKREPALEGALEYKRWSRKSVFSSKGWNRRYFRIQHRVLLCFADAAMTTLERAVPLIHTEIVSTMKHHSRAYYFQVRENKRELIYHLSADSQETMDAWVKKLRQEALAPPSSIPAMLTTKTLTEDQIARYGFFRSEIEFVRSVTDICEELRFVDRAERKVELKKRLEKLTIPGCVYLPMSQSTAPWRRVTRVLTDKGHPFSTRKRCPCLLTFEVISDGPQEMDIANYLHQTLGGTASLLDAGALHSKATSDWRGKFSSSARDSLRMIAPEVGESGARLDVAFSDANAGPDQADLQHGPPSLWVSEVEAGTPPPAPTPPMGFSNSRKGKQGALVEQAIKLAQTAAGAIKPAAEMPLVDLQALDDGTHTLNHEPSSTAQAMALASEEERMERTKSQRIKSMARGGAAPAGASELQLDRIIAKSNDDLRQEVFTMQLMSFLKEVWRQHELPLYLKTYRILSTSKNTGLLEVITNADSIDGVKTKLGPNKRLVERFHQLFPQPEEFAKAQRSYMEALAGSSLMCYILRIGDRHNGNIMIEELTGRISHIDFGFVLGMRPGKDKVPHTDFSFERAPWKLTSEMVEIMGGKGSPLWDEYIRLLQEGLVAVRKQAATLLTLVEIQGYKSIMPCFNQPGGGVARVLRELKARLMLDVKDEDKVRERVKGLAEASYQAFGTIMYEKFQLSSNGIKPIF